MLDASKGGLVVAAQEFRALVFDKSRFHSLTSKTANGRRTLGLLTTIDSQLPVCPLLILGIMLPSAAQGDNSGRIKEKSCSKSVRLLSQFS